MGKNHYLLCLLYLVILLNLSSHSYADSGVTSLPSPDGNWTVESYLNTTGIFTLPISSDPITATYNHETLSGSSGCNEYTTQYTAANGALIIVPPELTKNVCPPIILSQEDAYFHALSDTAFYSLNETHLVLMDDDEHVLILYTPANISQA